MVCIFQITYYLIDVNVGEGPFYRDELLTPDKVMPAYVFINLPKYRFQMTYDKEKELTLWLSHLLMKTAVST